LQKACLKPEGIAMMEVEEPRETKVGVTEVANVERRLEPSKSSLTSTRTRDLRSLADVAKELQPMDPNRKVEVFKGPRGPLAPVRRCAAKVVQKWWFEWFILFLIFISTITMCIYQYTDPECDLNFVIDRVIDPILLAFFTVECILKVTAWGLIWRADQDHVSYLCDFPWNWLDLVVVITGWMTIDPNNGDGIGSSLRIFRALRPLRSMTMLPELRKYVITVLNSIRGLIDVMLMAIFIFTVFAIIGITLWGGIFYRRCRKTQNPVLSASGQCWEWEVHDPDDPRLCGGRYECPSGIRCGGHIDDLKEDYRPVFPGGSDLGLHWCEGDRDIKTPKKTFAETDFIHFDHIGGALLVVFQSMTMEGWVDIMYMVQDGAGMVAPTLYFIFVILVTSFFVLNMILAVISETYEDIETLDAQEESEKEKSEKDTSEALEPMSPKSADGKDELEMKPRSSEELGLASVEDALDYLGKTKSEEDEAWKPKEEEHHEKEEEYWIDCVLVRVCYNLQDHEVFRATVLFFIVANVVVMLLEKYPPDLHLKAFQQAMHIVFAVVFGLEMIIMLVGLGPKTYVTTPLTLFDGIIVIGSFVDLFASGEGGSPLTVLRIFRLARVVVKISNGVPAFGLLLRSMVKTVKSLGYFGLLFFLVLLICTLMGMQFFATRFHFNSDWDGVLDDGRENDPVRVFCVGPGYGERDEDENKDCIPRANFDTFIEGFTTIFQVMSGENWNTVMYDAMRSREPVGWFYGAGFFVILILFGQTLMLNLFLTILMARFADAEESLKKEEEERRKQKKLKKRASFSGAGFYSETKRRMLQARTMDRSQTDYVTMVGDGDLAKRSASEPVCHRSLKSEPKKLGMTEMSGEQKPEESTWLPGQLPSNDSTQVMDYNHEVISPAERSGVEDAVEAQDLPLMSYDLSKAMPPEIETLPPKPDESYPAISETCASGLTSVSSTRPPKVYPDRWPYSYALLLFHRDSIIRTTCQRIVSNPYFDHFILMCIVVSSLCMALATPLDDPGNTFTQILKTLDVVFSVIFILEMVMKLVCYGLLFFSPKSYLLNGWNILDGTVVIVSIVDLIGTSSTGFLKTLRILRAFRPLRVIARNQALQVAVTTLFKSLPELVTLVLALMIFLLIVAIVLLQYLNGRFYDCFNSDGDPVKLGGDDIGPALAGGFDAFKTPLCASPGNVSVVARGSWDGAANSWTAGNCSSGFVQWERASMDTPICVGRCSAGNKLKVHGTPPEAICPKQLSRIQELPSVCPSGELNLEPESDSPYYADELIGARYVRAQLANWILPCGTPKDLSGVEVAASSCRDLFCPDRGPSEYCKSACKDHHEFCADTCAAEPDSQKCSRCLEQCEAWCECEDYCEPLSREAAICVEQGGTWGPVLSQNFNTIANAMLTLFELTTTEGWVDVMYAAVDSRVSPFDNVPFYMTPERGSRVELWCIVFCLYIFFSNMFIINLSVGVIVENFINIKRETGSAESFLLTKAQEKWVLSQKSLYGRACLFQLTNLHHKPKWQRRTYIFISSSLFENFIMTAIVLNTLLMACNAFPLPVEGWDTFLLTCNYIFAGIFFVEFVIKLYALRVNYWKDSWNLFDFLCVMATIVGVIVKEVFGLNMGSVMSVIRIFRVARLFRLLRFMKGVNKIFMALVFSAPKLGNVIFLLMLLMGMYSILGVQLFATQKFSETMNTYGNFRSIFMAFTTLFRSMTGEAWNEIMHDLAKGEYEYAREGEWCSPKKLFHPEEKENYDILQDKCLIEHPNRCGDPNGYWPQIYFVSFTIIITFTVLNLVIAVILDGYEDGKEHTEAEVIDTCIRVWKKYDQNYTMFLSFMDAFRYVDEVLLLFPDVNNPHECSSPSLRPSSSGVFGMDLTTVPMRYANDFDLVMTEDGNVHFMHVVKLVIQIVVSQNDPSLKTELKAVHNKMSDKDYSKLKSLESRQMQKNRAVLGHSLSLRAQVAASKIQKKFKEGRLNRGQISRPLHPADQISAESFSEPNPPETGIESMPSAFTQEEHLEPRSPANVDGLDEPGRTKIVSVNPGNTPSDGDAPQEDRAAPTPSPSPSPVSVAAPPVVHRPPPGVHQPPPGG